MSQPCPLDLSFPSSDWHWQELDPGVLTRLGGWEGDVLGEWCPGLVSEWLTLPLPASCCPSCFSYPPHHPRPHTAEGGHMKPRASLCFCFTVVCLFFVAETFAYHNALLVFTVESVFTSLSLFFSCTPLKQYLQSLHYYPTSLLLLLP